MVDIQFATSENRRGKERRKKIGKNKKPQDENIMACPITQGGHKKKENTGRKYNVRI